MPSASIPSGWPTKRALPLPHSLWLAPVNCWHALPEHMKGLMTGCVIYGTHCKRGQKQQPLPSLSQARLSRQLLGWNPLVGSGLPPQAAFVDPWAGQPEGEPQTNPGRSSLTNYQPLPGCSSPTQMPICPCRRGAGRSPEQGEKTRVGPLPYGLPETTGLAPASFSLKRLHPCTLGLLNPHPGPTS